MILADRQQLSQFSKKRAVVIRQREVDMLHDSFSVLATQCAFLVAIAFIEHNAETGRGHPVFCCAQPPSETKC